MRGRDPDLRAALQRLGGTIHAQRAATGALEGESVEDARRRNFARACAEADQRDRVRQTRCGAEAAQEELWSAGMPVYRDGERWMVAEGDRLVPLDDGGLVELAAEREFGRLLGLPSAVGGDADG